jgi:flagellar L-ring protein precursor FlgH
VTHERPARTPAPATTVRRGLTLVLVIGGAAALLACSARGRPYEPKVRQYKAEAYDPVTDRRAEGSLWNESADTLFTYRRAARVGDLITVVIDESSNATRDANTTHSRSSSMQLGVDGLFGLVERLKKADPNLDATKLISVMSKSEFAGKGQTARSGSLRATLTARIKRVMQNGDLYVEGTKVVLVNEEESHLYLSGVVRPADVQADNSVLSSEIADMEVEYTGRGSISEKQQQGWLVRFIDWINPF